MWQTLLHALQRASSQAGLATDPAGPPTRVLAALRYYRSLGFFSDPAAGDDETLLDQLAATGDVAELEMLYLQADPLADLVLLSRDEARVWWEDLEADVGDENGVYEATLARWAQISRGAFRPVGIREHWATATGPITVTFAVASAPQRLVPEYRDDWLDQSLLNPINALIAATGYRFEVFEPFDQTAFVVVLTADEKARLRHERGWRFAT